MEIFIYMLTSSTSLALLTLAITEYYNHSI